MQKLTLHIPHAAYADGAFVPVDFERFKTALSRSLASAGFPNWYSVPAEGCYKGRRYAEELFSVFVGSADEADCVSKIFTDTFSAENETMRQEAFAMERNGKLIVIPL